jgi:hypothetical protein
MRDFVLGLAGAILAASLITPAAALPRTSGVTSPGLVQQVDRRCHWWHGHCRHEPSIVIDLGSDHYRRHYHNDHHDNDHHDNDHNDRGDRHGDKH